MFTWTGGGPVQVFSSPPVAGVRTPEGGGQDPALPSLQTEGRAGGWEAHDLYQGTKKPPVMDTPENGAGAKGPDGRRPHCGPGIVIIARPFEAVKPHVLERQISLHNSLEGPVEGRGETGGYPGPGRDQESVREPRGPARAPGRAPRRGRRPGHPRQRNSTPAAEGTRTERTGGQSPTGKGATHPAPPHGRAQGASGAAARGTQNPSFVQGAGRRGGAGRPPLGPVRHPDSPARAGRPPLGPHGEQNSDFVDIHWAAPPPPVRMGAPGRGAEAPHGEHSAPGPAKPGRGTAVGGTPLLDTRTLFHQV